MLFRSEDTIRYKRKTENERGDKTEGSSVIDNIRQIG